MEGTIMINISSIQAVINEKKTCVLWLKPETLSANQIKNTINQFSNIIDDYINPSIHGKDYICNDISILIDDIQDMKSISNQEKNEAILQLIKRYPKKLLHSLAKRALYNIDKQLEKYHKEINNLWLNGEYNPEAIRLLDEYKEWEKQRQKIT